ncbi:MAG: hypothetical protein JEY94_10525 [Melioribacteraceae bacterium]|nr:hypothetical protein [Melioribacteraceae bacterium]
MSKVKVLCKWDDSGYEKKLDKLISIVKDSKFVCTKCGRTANDKKYLCKAVKIN